MEKWKDADIQTLDEAKAFKVTQTNVVNFSREKTPEWLNERNNAQKVNDSKDDDPQLEKDREAFLAQLKKDWGE
ncbi:hypothetical protein ACO2FA_12840 [Staphylococcus warneri]